MGIPLAPIAATGDTPGVNLRQLEYFLVIAEEGSFTRAAERLLVAQPSLSQQIGALEAELGGPLLERMPRGVRLTTAGHSFLPEARAAISHADRARLPPGGGGGARPRGPPPPLCSHGARSAGGAAGARGSHVGGRRPTAV